MNIQPAKIAWLKPKIRNEKHKLPEELLTEEEVLRLAEAAGNVRDKAFILTLSIPCSQNACFSVFGGLGTLEAV